MSDTIKDALSLLAIFTLALMLWIATPGDAHAAILTDEGAGMFLGWRGIIALFLYTSFVLFLGICVTALLTASSRASREEEGHEYDRRDRL